MFAREIERQDHRSNIAWPVHFASSTDMPMWSDRMFALGRERSLRRADADAERERLFWVESGHSSALHLSFGNVRSS